MVESYSSFFEFNTFWRCVELEHQLVSFQININSQCSIYYITDGLLQLFSILRFRILRIFGTLLNFHADLGHIYSLLKFNSFEFFKNIQILICL